MRQRHISPHSHTQPHTPPHTHTPAHTKKAEGKENPTTGIELMDAQTVLAFDSKLLAFGLVRGNTKGELGETHP